MREETPTSWEELNAFLWEKSLHSATGKYKPYTAFRGVAESYGNLNTSLKRLSGDLIRTERRIIDNFSMYARDDLRHGLTDWHVLLLGQHYRLPTRLLDWTSSPLAAMYFASEKVSSKDKDGNIFYEDGEIFCVLRLETINTLSPIFADLLEKQGGGSNLFSLETLSSNFPDMTVFDSKEPTPATPSLLFFEPPSISPRIVNQYAFFSVIPDPYFDTLDWLEAHKPYCWKVIVPADLKKEIRERLSVMNVSERTIYPGLDGTSQWLKAYYTD